VLHAAFDSLIEALLAACRAHYGERLVSLAVYGSVARRAQRFDSDLDCLLVVEGLPHGRMRRVQEFGAVEAQLASRLRALAEAGIVTEPSPVFKTPEEVERGSPLFLDLTEDARLVHDRDGFLARYLEGLRQRLGRLGARRVWRGNAWHWVLKPDLRPGEVIEL
jgi:predicted nucleotidyltransferase